MVLSYQSPHLAKATEVVAVERTGGLHHYTVSAGAENYHPNQVSNLASSLEIARADGGAIVLVSTIPNGFAIVDNDVFEGKKIIATKPFKKGEQLYVGHCAVLDLSGIGHGFKLKIYSEDRQLLSQHFNDDTHSVDDHAPGSKTGSESKRQVYGWDGFMNHSCDANSYHRKLLFIYYCLSQSVSLYPLSNDPLLFFYKNIHLSQLVYIALLLRCAIEQLQYVISWSETK